MDLTKLLSSSQVKQISKEVGIDPSLVEALVGKAAPGLVGNMVTNSKKSKSGAESLVQALLSHADDDDDKVDEADGAKILQHLLGNDKASFNTNIAGAMGGLDAKTVERVLAMAAPVLLKSLGKSTKKTQAAKNDLDVTDLLGAVLGGAQGKAGKNDGFDLGDAIDAAQKVGKLLGKIK